MGELVGRTHGVLDAYQCSTICDAQDLCTAFTLWGSTSLVHWEECWTFSACIEEQVCDECTTGRKSGDCSSTTRTTSRDTTVKAESIWWIFCQIICQRSLVAPKKYFLL